MRSQELDGLGHGGLDVNGLHVVPALLEEGDQEVDSHHDVDSELIIGHLSAADGGVQAGDLLELPFDGGTEVLDLDSEWLLMGDDLWEHLDSVQDWTADDWDLLEDGVGSEQHGVLLGPVLDELLVLVVLLEGVKVDEVNVDVVLLDLVGVLLIGNHADLEVWSSVVWKTDGTNESLILLWVVILQANLELDGLLELALLHDLTEIRDSLSNGGVVNLGGHT